MRHIFLAVSLVFMLASPASAERSSQVFDVTYAELITPCQPGRTVGINNSASALVCNGSGSTVSVCVCNAAGSAWLPVDTDTNTDTYVTNKDSHDHLGGDGAQVQHTSLGSVGTSDHHTATVDTFVTNKDSHDHLGGDGAQVLHSSLGSVGSSDHHTATVNTDAESKCGPGEYLEGDGTCDVLTSGGTPAGSSTEIQFNTAGAFDSASTFVYSGGSLGVGTSTPALELEIIGDARLNDNRPTLYLYDDLTGANIGNNFTLGDIYFGGTETHETNATSAYIRGRAAEGWTAGKSGTDLEFGVAPVGGATPALGLVLFSDLSVGIPGLVSCDTIDTDASGNLSCGTDSSGHSNGANCAAGNSPLGVNASGAVESCFDVATQTELDGKAVPTGGATNRLVRTDGTTGDIVDTNVIWASGEDISNIDDLFADDFYFSDAPAALSSPADQCYEGFGLSRRMGPCTSSILGKFDVFTTLEIGLPEVLALRPVTYRWKGDPSRRLDLGLIAEEVEAVNPLLVTRPSADSIQLNRNGLIAMLIAAVQEQQKQIEELQRQVRKAQ